MQKSVRLPIVLIQMMISGVYCISLITLYCKQGTEERQPPWIHDAAVPDLKQLKNISLECFVLL